MTKNKRAKEIIKSHEEPRKPDGDYILNLIKLQLEYAGTYCAFEDFINDYEDLYQKTTITQEQANLFKAKVFEMLMDDFGYSIQKCNSEFAAFKAYYPLKVK